MAKLLIHTYSDEDQEEKAVLEHKKEFMRWFWLFTGGLVAFLLFTAVCMAEMVITEPNIVGYSLNQWCEAIHKAEGNDNYGILTHYKTTTPLQACRNTVLHKWRDYSALPSKTRQKTAFLTYLGQKYCPVGASNDPTGLNKNWVKNVGYWLERG